MQSMLKTAEIGGGVVRRPFNSGTERLPVGRKLSKAEVLRMPQANRDALVNKGLLHLVASTPSAASGDAERFVVHRGNGKYDVISGSAVNDTPLTKKEAEALAEISS